jgi:branched-chain amino acid transport system ATP-binding protein
VLELAGVDAFYGKSQILYDVSLEVRESEVVALLGRNGAGKTTTLKAAMGLVTSTGEVTFDGNRLDGSTPFQVARQGVAYVPENRGIFSRLTVEQNLSIAVRKGARWSLTDVYEHFPRLAERRGNKGDQLSGGEQQMLAIARAMLGAARIVLLDEPAEGLAPVIVERVADIIREMRREGVAILLVEQQIDLCVQLADRVYILESGQMVFSGTTAEFTVADDIRNRHLALRDV